MPARGKECSTESLAKREYSEIATAEAQIADDTAPPFTEADAQAEEKSRELSRLAGW